MYIQFNELTIQFIASYDLNLTPFILQSNQGNFNAPFTPWDLLQRIQIQCRAIAIKSIAVLSLQRPKHGLYQCSRIIRTICYPLGAFFRLRQVNLLPI